MSVTMRDGGGSKDHIPARSAITTYGSIFLSVVSVSFRRAIAVGGIGSKSYLHQAEYITP
jgi:hypothetical protein